ncbi:MAG: hypothetical protein AAGC57_12550 [Pseudomonadota bacterium]
MGQVHRAGLLIVGLVSLGWLAIALGAPVAPFTADELILGLAADAMANRASFVIENGYERYQAAALRLWFLVAGPDGLVAQYPGLHAVLAAPIWGGFGPRGLILANVLAAAGCLMATHALACRLYSDPRVALFAILFFGIGSFLVDYAIGIWPHAPAALTVVLAALWIFEADRQGGWPWRAALAGLVLSLGIGLRVDTAFAAVGIGVWVLVFAARPAAVLGWMAAGSGPGLLLCTWINQVKFGVPSPISYGSGRGGAIDPMSYLPLVGAAVAGALAILAIRRLPGRAPLVAVGALAALVLAAAGVVPMARALALSALQGAWSLLIDFRAYSGAASEAGFAVLADGTVTIHGIWKKALLQSAPWLAMLALIPLIRAPGHVRAAHGLCVLATLGMMLPFLLREWHGGISSNMRYFLPAMPLLAILGAWASSRLVERADLGQGGVTRTPPLLGGLGATLALAIYATSVAVPAGALQQSLPVLLAALLAGLAVTAAVPGGVGRIAARCALAPLAVSVLLAGVQAYGFDLRVNLARRALAERLEAPMAALPAGGLLIPAYVESVGPTIHNPEMFVAFRSRLTAEPDTDLAARALEDGRRLFAQSGEVARKLTDALPGTYAVPIAPPSPSQPTNQVSALEQIWEIRRASP